MDYKGKEAFDRCDQLSETNVLRIDDDESKATSDSNRFDCFGRNVLPICSRFNRAIIN